MMADEQTPIDEGDLDKAYLDQLLQGDFVGTRYVVRVESDGMFNEEDLDIDLRVSPEQARAFISRAAVRAFDALRIRLTC